MREDTWARRVFSRFVLAMLLVFGPVEIPSWRADPSRRAFSELVVGGAVLSFLDREQLHDASRTQG